MAKTFKNFRNDWDDDEWGGNDDYTRKSKEMRLQTRRAKRREKEAERYSDLDVSEDNEK